jgi:hypothetical protein
VPTLGSGVAFPANACHGKSTTCRSTEYRGQPSIPPALPQHLVDVKGYLLGGEGREWLGVEKARAAEGGARRRGLRRPQQEGRQEQAERAEHGGGGGRRWVGDLPREESVKRLAYEGVDLYVRIEQQPRLSDAARRCNKHKPPARTATLGDCERGWSDRGRRPPRPS